MPFSGEWGTMGIFGFFFTLLLIPTSWECISSLSLMGLETNQNIDNILSQELLMLKKLFFKTYTPNIGIHHSHVLFLFPVINFHTMKQTHHMKQEKGHKIQTQPLLDHHLNHSLEPILSNSKSNYGCWAVHN